MEAVGTLAGGIAHDFNNLLTSMRGLINCLEEQDGLNETMREALEDLRSVSTRAGDLTRQLLTFARRQPLHKEPADLREILAEVERMLRRLIGEQIEFRVEASDRACGVFVDRNLIAQVVINLAVNASDAMPYGGRLTVRVRPENLAVLPPAARRAPGPGRFVLLEVADTGCGIEATALPRIFEPFFTTKPEGQGTGLGLPMVLGIVEQHGGWIDVESTTGRGTSIRVFLPAYSGQLAAPVQVRERPGPGSGRERVLIVEDDPSVRRLAAAGMKHLGYTVFEAGSGPEALELWPPDGGNIAMLITDMVMPGGMTGLQLAETLRARAPSLRVIITSGYSQERDKLESLAREGMRFVPKPYDLPALAALARRMLDGVEAAVREDARSADPGTIICDAPERAPVGFAPPLIEPERSS
jgi:CheY-like chemotaxis protein